MWFKLTFLWLAWFSVAFVCGCATDRPSSKRPLLTWGPDGGDLLPPEEAHKVDFSQTKIEGGLSASDIRQLAALLGRVKGIEYVASVIDAKQEAGKTIVRIFVPNYMIYCIKDRAATWKISDFAHFNSD
jgi:hypothetical protein